MLELSLALQCQDVTIQLDLDVLLLYARNLGAKDEVSVFLQNIHRRPPGVRALVDERPGRPIIEQILEKRGYQGRKCRS